MKRFTTLFFIAVCNASLLFSQVTLTKATHGFASGQNHTCQAVEYLAPGNGGENLVWNFSQVAYKGEVTSSSNIENNSENGNIRAVRNDDCTFFFNITDKSNEYVGYKSAKATCKLTSPIVKTQYPQKYNTRFEGTFSGLVTTEGVEQPRPVEGTYSTHADATGILMLPDDITLAALRVKTTERSGAYEMVKYLWYAQDTRFPVFVTTEEYYINNDDTRVMYASGSYLNTQINKSLSSLTSLSSLSSLSDLTTPTYKVFPNPFQDEVQLTYFLPEKTNVTVTLYNSNGAKLTDLISNETQVGSNSVSKNVARYTRAPGVYLLKIQFGSNIYTEKLVKAH